MKLLTVFVLVVAVAAGAVEKSDTSNNDVLSHDFQEEVHLNQDEADSKIIDLDDEESSGNYYDDDEDYDDEDYDDEDYDDDYDEDDYEEDDDWEEGSGEDEYDDGEYIDAVEEEKEEHGGAGTDLHFATDDKAEEDDLLYEYHAEMYDEEKDYDFSKEEEKVYQPPQVQIREHFKPGDDSVSVESQPAVPAVSTSRNLLISVFVASGLASFALFTLAFVMCFCHKRTSANGLSEKGGTEKGGLPFVIHAKGSHTSTLPPPPSSIIKGNRYQPVPTHENRTNHSIENANSLLKSQQLEEKLLLP